MRDGHTDKELRGELSNTPQLPQRLGLTSSLGVTLDAFFPSIVAEWQRLGTTVFSASATPAHYVGNHSQLPGLTRNPDPRTALAARRAVRNWVEATRVEAVITNTATASAVSRIARTDCPIIYFCHGLHWSDNTRWNDGWLWKRIERYLLRRTAGVICINSRDEEWFASHAPDVPRLFLPWGVGVELDRFERVPSANTRQIRLVWAGEFNKRKDPIAALRVAAHLRDIGEDFELRMLGDGPLVPSAQDFIQQHRLSAWVQLVGHVDPKGYLGESTALLLTSKWEGLPRIGLEALATGRPIVGFACKGVEDLTQHLANPGDAVGLAQEVVRVHKMRRTLVPTDPHVLASRAAAQHIAKFVAEVLGS